MWCERSRDGGNGSCGVKEGEGCDGGSSGCGVKQEGDGWVMVVMALWHSQMVGLLGSRTKKAHAA